MQHTHTHRVRPQTRLLINANGQTIKNYCSKWIWVQNVRVCGSMHQWCWLHLRAGTMQCAHIRATFACAVARLGTALPSPVIKYWVCVCKYRRGARRPTDVWFCSPFLSFYFIIVLFLHLHFCIIYTWGHILSERKSPEHTTNWSSFFLSPSPSLFNSFVYNFCSLSE